MKWLPLVVVLVACKDKAPAPAPSPASPPTGPMVTADAKPADAPNVDAAVARAKVVLPLPDAQVRALFDAWLAAQNSGAFDQYAALYGEPFKGVRRTGRKTLRLDRAGWLADRKKMFARPMVVSAAHVVIVSQVARATVTFEQTWSSGKFRDVGPKTMTIVETPAGLRIATEELLASRIVPSSSSGDLLATLWRGAKTRVVLPGELDLARLGPPVLLEGTLIERDPTCDSDPPDYEQDNNRYFDCSASRPSVRYDDFKAEAPVKALPAALAGIEGGDYVAYTAQGVACAGPAGKVVAYAERETTQERITANGMRPRDLARAALETAGGYATSIGSCTDIAFVRPAGSPVPVFWKLETLSELNAAPYLEQLRAHDEYGTWENNGPDLEIKEEVRVATSPDGRIRIVIAVADGWRNCDEAGFVALIWREPLAVGAPGSPELELLYAESARPFRIDAVADILGDGRPEIVVDDGFVLESGTDDEGGATYARAVTLPFTAEVPGCPCDVEGFGCEVSSE